MDIRKIKKLIDLLDQTGVAEIEIHEGDDSVRITRAFANSAAPAPAPAIAIAPAIAAPAAALSTEAEAPTGNVIRSPMVGTFYRASSPSASPFVEVGHAVKVGQNVCIIEAMKILNQIESDFSGKITRILVDDGEAIEFDQPLFIVE